MTNIDVSGVADIRSISDLCRQLMQALLADSAVEMRLGDVREADVAFVQMVEAARRYARESGKTFALATAPPPLQEVLERGGFLQSEADRCFWLQSGRA